ncbi:hypothetical protein H9643_01240 [Ochrobactrum sp. Sa2BUA5]|nr:hypothetical protein [Ochrobactrum gallinarum]
MDKILQRRILLDEPSKSDLFHGKGHERTADALVAAITEFGRDDRSIGLDGPWGSGKSSVVEIAREKLEGAERDLRFHFFTFDIWRSQGTSFRRSFLEHFLSWCKANFSEKSSELDEIEKGIKGKTRTVESKNQSILDWWGILVVFFLPIAPIYYFWAKYQFDESKNGSFIYSGPIIILTLFIIGTIVVSICHYRKKQKKAPSVTIRGKLRDLKVSISQTLLIGSKHYEDQTVTQYIREIDPNDFEFLSTLRAVLSLVQNDKRRIVFVMDNIDRLPKEEINQYWAQVRAVFSNGVTKRLDDGSDAVTAIVPYDRHLIESEVALTGSSKGDTLAPISALKTREIFSKTFDEILKVSPPVMSNSREFFMEKVRIALPGLYDDDALFRSYLIFDQILRRENGYSTPRQIIMFINELAGNFVLHGGKFRLPTIAMYLAYQDVLEENPLILNTPSRFDPRIQALTGDNDLERNLAAIIFNVDPELSFQLLLDEQIKIASTEGAEALVTISSAPGFEIRVDEVVQQGIPEWISGGVFFDVIFNYASLRAQRHDEAAKHVCRSLVGAVEQLTDVDITDHDEYQKLLRVFEFADGDQVRPLCLTILRLGLASLADEDLTVETGRDWTTFAASIATRVMEAGRENVVPSVLKNIELPHNVEFIFGAASNTKDENLDVSSFKLQAGKSVSDDATINRLSLEYPAYARTAFSEMRRVSWVKKAAWVAIANDLINALQSSAVEEDDKFSDMLQLLAELYGYAELKSRAEISLGSLLQSQQFYSNVTERLFPDGDAFASLIFLLVINCKGGELPEVLLRESDEVNHTRAIYLGEQELTEAQLRCVAKLSIEALVVTSLLEKTTKTPHDKLLRSIVRTAFCLDQVPRIDLNTLLQHYKILRDILGGDISTALEALDGRISNESVEKLALDQCEPELIEDLKGVSGPQLRRLSAQIDKLLNDLSGASWSEHFQNNDHTCELLLKRLSVSPLRINNPEYRDAVLKILLEVIGDQIEFEEDIPEFDLLIDAIDIDFHDDLIRHFREKLADVNASSLNVAMNSYPSTISRIVRADAKLSAHIKDNLVRFLLCPAIEASNEEALSYFYELGSTRVRDFINNSDESTRKKLEAVWSNYAEKEKDRDRVESLTQLIHGKRKTRSILERLLGY